MLNEAQQPYNYLIESIRARDTQNQTLSEQLALMEEETRSGIMFIMNFLTTEQIHRGGGGGGEREGVIFVIQGSSTPRSKPFTFHTPLMIVKVAFL